MTDIIEKLKYGSEISDLISKGIKTPEMIIPNNLDAFRWVFDSENSINHLPVYLQRPQRFIQAKEKDKLQISGFALSCYDNELNAENNYKKFLKSIPNFWKIVGNSISKGKINEPDGRITESSTTGHFDLYEFVDCNLNSTFAITKKLI